MPGPWEFVSHKNGTGNIVISFANRSLKLDKADDASCIVEKLKENVELTTLDLSGNTLGISAAEPIGAALESNSNLKYCLFHDLFTGRLKTEIGPALKYLSFGIMASGAQLVELDLSDNAFGPNGVVGVIDLLASPACSTLQILRMNNQGLGHEGCRYLSEALQKGRNASGKRGLCLKVFTGGRNRLENVGAKLLSEVFADMGSLEELSLCQNGIGIHGVEGIHALVRILENNPNLRVVNFSDNNVTPLGGRALAKAMRLLPNLEELHLSDCILRSSGTRVLVKSLEHSQTAPNLRVLTLTGNEITQNAGISVILSLRDKSRLELLDLNANEFGQSGVDAILQTLKSVNLLHVLPKPADENSSELVGSEVYAHAFDEDQGSASEAEDEGEEEEEEDDEEEEEEEEDDEDDEDEENKMTAGDAGKPGHEPHKSFTGVQATTGFSFRQSLFGTGTPCSPLNAASPGTNSSQLSNSGLFSTIRTPDSVDAASMRSKLWPSGTPSTGLFSSFAAASTTTNQERPKTASGGLFAPSLFSVPLLAATKTVTATSTPNATKQQPDMQQLDQQFRRCFSSKNMATAVGEFARSLNQSDEPIAQSTIRSCADTEQPENVVRLSLHLMHHTCPQPPSSSPAQSASVKTAHALLSNVLMSDSPQACKETKTLFTPSRTSRAVNCLLVYLGAIKAEKGDEDDCYLKSVPPSERQSHLTAYLQLTRQLVEQSGQRLPPDIRSCLTTLLSEQRTRTDPSLNVDKSVNVLRDDLLNLLTAKLGGFHI